MSEPIWISKALVLAMHQMQIDEFGGTHGIRDEHLLESALQRPINRFDYELTSDIIALGASYADAITRNHPFLDGNKRVAFHTMLAFLRLNGFRCVAGEADATAAMLALSDGSMDRDAFADWLRGNVTPQP